MGDLGNLIARHRELIEVLKDLEISFNNKSNSQKTRDYLEILSQELDNQFQQFKYQHEEITRILR